MTNTILNIQLELLNSHIQSFLSQDLEFIGIGADLCDINRMQTLYNKWNAKIAARILSEAEYYLWSKKGQSVPFLAKRWAGKEAIVKSIGFGFAKGLRWREVSILNDENGKPYVEFLGQTKALLQHQQSQVHCFISLADEQATALGFSVAVRIKNTILDA